MNHIVKISFVAFSSFILLSCASNPSVSSLSSQERQRVAQLVVFESGAISRTDYDVIESVEGIACKRNLYASGTPSLDEAKQGVRIRAALADADAVTNMLCEDKQQVDWGRNCWQTVVCVGDAITVKNKSVLSRERAKQQQ